LKTDLFPEEVKFIEEENDGDFVKDGVVYDHIKDCAGLLKSIRTPVLQQNLINGTDS